MSHFRYRVSKLASIFVMAGLLALGSAVAEAKTVIRIAFETNLNVLPGLAFVVFKNLVESKSNGTMEVQLFPSMQLGTNLEMIEGVKAGTHEMGTSTLAWFSSFYPKIEMFEMPFCTNLEMIEGVKAGTHEMGTSTLAWFSSFYPKIEMFEMP